MDSEIPSGPNSNEEDEDMCVINDHLTVIIPEGVKVPTQGSSGSPDWDLRSNQSITLQPSTSTKVNVGLSAAIPTSYCLVLPSCTKLASKGITVQGGLIDSDYRGPILAILHNSTDTPRRILKGERIAQSIFLPTPDIMWTHVSSLNETT